MEKVKQDLFIRWHNLLLELKDRFDKKPDLQTLLFLIGINEVGFEDAEKQFTKEQKQDLMHVATCFLMSQARYYEYDGHDADGSPHYIATKKIPEMNLREQEELLQELILEYFEEE